MNESRKAHSKRESRKAHKTKCASRRRTRMTVPNSVANAAEQATALQAEFYPADESLGQAESNLGEQGKESVPAPQQNEQVEPAAKKDTDALYWESRFNVLRGKYDAEIPRLNDQISELNKKLSAVSGPSNDVSDGASKLARQIEDQLTEDELEMVGPDLLQVMKKLVNSSNSHDSSRESEELKQVKADIERSKQESADHKHAQFMSRLEHEVPDWREIQADEGALAWLAEADPISGIIRDASLKNAASNFDSHRAINIFRQMKQEATSRPKDNQQRQIPASKVQPTASRNTGQPQGGEAITKASITQFYRDMASGRYTDEQGKAKEAEIFKAVNEGRVI